MFFKNTPKSHFSNYSDEEWLNLLANPNKSIPPLPPEEIQVRFCGRSGLLAMEQAMAFYKVIRDFCKEDGKTIDSMNGILEFGCGWGRITRCFLRDIRPESIYACDCIHDMVQLCKKDIPGCQFTQIDPMPPTSFRKETFDLIYAYSVFSHLSEEAHKAWLEEFHRVLCPGGILVLTTRPRDFISYWPKLPYIKEIDVEKSLRDYDGGKFVHIPTGGGDNLSASFYGETAIPKDYVARVWSKWFSLEKFIGDVLHVDQNIIILNKK